MTEHDYEKALRMIQAVEIDLRRYLLNPAEYRSGYLEDTHCCIIEVMRLLSVEPIEANHEDQ